MTPKEKAKELVEAMAFSCRECDYEAKAKQCALIAVNQLIEYQDFFMDYVRMDLPSNIVAGLPYKYWDKVKKEIEAL
jgi:deoxyribodipyrimidine photolyase-like uncharacterized protein